MRSIGTGGGLLAGFRVVVRILRWLCLLPALTSSQCDVIFAQFSRHDRILVLNFLSGWKMRKVRELSGREETHLAIAGGVSLVCWLTAGTAGRMIGYW